MVETPRPAQTGLPALPEWWMLAITLLVGAFQPVVRLCMYVRSTKRTMRIPACVLLCFLLLANCSAGAFWGATRTFSNSGPAPRRPRRASSLSVVLKQQDPASTEQTKVVASSAFLGDLHRIRMEGEEDGFVSAMGVPTFAAACRQPTSNDGAPPEDTPNAPPTARGLEGVLNQGPAFVLDGILSRDQCQDIIETCEQLGFADYRAGKNNHGALQLLVAETTADSLAQALSRHVDLDQVEERRKESEAALPENKTVELIYAGLNRRWRVYRYHADSAETFAPHIDAGFPPSGLSEDGNELIWDTNTVDSVQIVSRLTVLLYLNDDFVGGETKFYQESSSNGQSEPNLIASVRPKMGSCLVFPQGVGEAAVDYARHHWPLHEGAPVVSGSPKYVIRSDILFCSDERTLPLDDALFQHDHKVRATFLPQSSVSDRKFLGLTASTYCPQMGVENLGPYLYSLIRFTKKRRIVEIGAGYTSLWILQALKDNEDEMQRVRDLGRRGEAKLLDYPWVNAETVENYWDEPAQLMCIDNCRHQKETATGAVAIAQQLGLSPYLDFVVGDAFEIAKTFEKDSIDVLWCDFGVGSRMKDFVQGAWASLRPGGFLLCHSTLTNERTREWLEAVRTRQAEEVTGLPPDEYVEVSFLEPHKLFQNSVSVLQKRKDYSEPLYSEYA